jgi:ATP-dependent Zn protease
MIPGARPPYGNRPFAPRWYSLVLTVLGIVILAVFIVDKVVVSPPESGIPVAAVIDHLNRHDVRRVTIPARQITVELNDGKTISTNVTSDRDLWPAIKRSGADVTIVARSGADDEASPMRYVFQFVPFVIMALLLLFIFRNARRSAQ